MQYRYVNTASSAGGDGTTNEISGATRAYAALAEAVYYLPATLTEPYTIYFSGGADTNPILQAYCNHTTSAANYVSIEPLNAANKAVMPFDTGRYHLAITNNNGFYNNIMEHLRIDGLQVLITVNNSSGYIGIKTTNANQTGAGIDCRTTNCLVKAVMTSGAIVGFVTRIWDGGASGNALVKNCIALDCNYGFGEDNQYAKYYNCAAINCVYGFVADAAWQVTNCLASGCTIGFVGSFAAASNYNAEDDGNGAPGANSYSATTFTFVNSGTGDFHLGSTDTGAIGRGYNLYNDATYSFQDDIDGQDRGGAAAAWDIGADEYVAAIVPLLLNQYRARRQ